MHIHTYNAHLHPYSELSKIQSSVALGKEIGYKLWLSLLKGCGSKYLSNDYMLKEEVTLEGSKTFSCPVCKYKAFYGNIGQDSTSNSRISPYRTLLP